MTATLGLTLTTSTNSSFLQALDAMRAGRSGVERLQFGDRVAFLAYAPLAFISAETGKGLTALLAAAERAHLASRTRVTTGQLNRVLEKAARANAPKAAKGGAPVKILFATQIGVSPPTFALSINHDVDLHFSYKRYLENKLRAAFGFEGTPIVLKVRHRPH